MAWQPPSCWRLPLLILSIPKPAQHSVAEKPSSETLFAGFRYIWGEKIVLGAISLDLFAVLLSGAVALLPVYARDILELGPWGLGLLRAAPGVGAIAVAVWLAGHPIRDHAGLVMFVFVAMFGVFTVVFGVSTMPWLSIVALALIGATDMISVYVRETLIQLWTPDRVRGRVNAVNMRLCRRLQRARRIPRRHHGSPHRHRAGGRLRRRRRGGRRRYLGLGCSRSCARSGGSTEGRKRTGLRQ